VPDGKDPIYSTAQHFELYSRKRQNKMGHEKIDRQPESRVDTVARNNKLKR
jgi:hypothetical protein